MSNALIESIVAYLDTMLEDDSKQGSHLKFWTGGDNDTTLHHVHDTPHGQHSVDQMEKHIAQRMHEKYPNHYKSAKDAHKQYVEHNHADEEGEGYGSFYHHLLHDKHDTPEKPDREVHHKTAKEYVDHAAEDGHKWIQSFKGGQYTAHQTRYEK